jgi:choline dehydrogenase-like flavoprotein
MLSGIGPRAELERHGIPVHVDLPGVGQSLQDRYEVAVVNRMSFPSWKALEGATFNDQDGQYREWARRRDGVYKTNGALLSVVARSSPAAPDPDLFLYSVLGRFEGYFPGYSANLAKNPNCLTWIVLKARTNNTAGHLTLQSRDPRVPPAINFRYFDEGSDPKYPDRNGALTGQDLEAVVKGITLARQLADGLKKQNLVAAEEVPGPKYETPEELREFVRNEAWGHHASCTCRIGARADGGVLSTDFKVHGTRGLRVVDASVFPRIPGFFIVSAVYMIGEKAADVIAAEARGTGLRGLLRRPYPRSTPIDAA